MLWSYELPIEEGFYIISKRPGGDGDILIMFNTITIASSNPHHPRPHTIIFWDSYAEDMIELSEPSTDYQFMKYEDVKPKWISIMSKKTDKQWPIVNKIPSYTISCTTCGTSSNWCEICTVYNGGSTGGVSNCWTPNQSEIQRFNQEYHGFDTDIKQSGIQGK